MVTALAPYASHPDLPQFHGQVEECAEELGRAGRLARELGIRLSTHPGQYTVLNSEDPGVVANAVAELEVQAALMDAMGLDRESVVVLHVGGAAGGLEAGADRFLRGFERLSDAARRRLVIENDDRVYGIGRSSRSPATRDPRGLRPAAPPLSRPRSDERPRCARARSRAPGET